MTDVDTAQKLAPAETRSAQVVDWSFPTRTIEVIAVPYDEETIVPHEGRVISEQIAPGSFNGIERRANRIRVNREHDQRFTCGRAVAFHPSRVEGLVTELRMAQTPLGEETLQLAADGMLDASIGFSPFIGHEGWSPDRRSRRITKAFLWHIAMVAEPAYDGAQVLAVRSAVPAETTAASAGTPNLDVVQGWLLEADYGRRWTQ